MFYLLSLVASPLEHSTQQTHPPTRTHTLTLPIFQLVVTIQMLRMPLRQQAVHPLPLLLLSYWNVLDVYGMLSVGLTMPMLLHYASNLPHLKQLSLIDYTVVCACVCVCVCVWASVSDQLACTASKRKYYIPLCASPKAFLSWGFWGRFVFCLILNVFVSCVLGVCVCVCFSF